MAMKYTSKLNPKKRYLQIALNSSLEDAKKIINNIPASDKIIIEAGTPLIKMYGSHAISSLRDWQETRLIGTGITPYIVADLKTMDRGSTEVEMAAAAGASAAVALGTAPSETLDSFIEECEKLGLDSMIDMMNVEFPLANLRKLKKPPVVVILHRGVDEEKFNREKQLPLHEIRRVKGNYDILIAVAGGDTVRDAQRAIFNDADIVVIWKSVFQETKETVQLVEQFLKEIK